MNKKLIEYLIIATAVILLIYGCYSMMTYKYEDNEKLTEITDSISLYHPLSSDYTVNGDTVEFRNVLYDFYDMDVSKLSSSDKKVTDLLNHYAKFNQGSTNLKDESCYLITVETEDDNGFNYHAMIIPIDSFNRDDLSFSSNATVYLFDGNNRQFVADTALNSQVVL